MSTENIKLFFEQAKTDSAQLEKISEICRDGTKSGIEALVRLSKQAGTPFTVEEFISTIPKMDELSNAELEGVAGGQTGSNYVEMWAQDVAAMVGYHGGATG